MSSGTGPEPRRPDARSLPHVDLLPETTSDDRSDGSDGFDAADRYDDEHYRRERPPHHG